MTSSPASVLVAQAAQQLNGGDLVGAWNSYMAAVQAEPGHHQAWLGLGMTAMLQRQWPVLEQLADRRQALAGDGFAYFHDVMTVMMTYGLHPLVLELGRYLPVSSPYAVSQLYQAGCIRLLAGDEDGAFGDFVRLKQLLAVAGPSLPIGAQDRFNVAYRQATLIEDGDYPDGLDQSRLAAVADELPPMREIGSAGGEGGDFVVLAACDGRYLDRFGADFLAALDRLETGLAVHLHVVEASPATLAQWTERAGRSRQALTLSHEGENRFRSGAYYASARFLVAAEIMARHGGKPLLICDVDIAFLRRPSELAQLAAPFAFASFVHDGAGPCSRLPAVVTWFSGVDGRAMLGALRQTILSKLEVQWPHNWMLDQAALMTARRWLRRRHRQAAIGDLGQAGGQPFTHYLRCLGDEDEKAALIRAAGENQAPAKR